MAFLNNAGLERLWAHILSRLNRKVDKVEGKGLSTNDFTNEDKEKLNTQSDWNQEDENAINYIKNKPLIDSTLSVKGSTADAKAVGDAIAELNSKIPDGQGANMQLVTDADGNVKWEDRLAYYKNEAVFPQQNVDFADQNGLFVGTVSGVDFVFAEDKTYIVHFDGTLYECKSEIMMNMGIIGDTQILANGTSSGTFPFVMFVNEGEDPKVLTIGSTLSLESVSICIETAIPQKMNAAFLLDGASIGAFGEGESSEVFNDYSSNIATGDYAHVVGRYNSVAGLAAHAEGQNNIADGLYAHVEGGFNEATGDESHAEGQSTVASAHASHAEGFGTVAAGDCQHVQGKYNIIDASEDELSRGKYLHIVGNGSDLKRSNAHTLDWSGNAWYQGTIKVGGTGQDDEVAKDVMLAPSTAQVGQTIVVKSVDENGKPTEWEAADMASGSGLPEGATAHQQLVTDAEGNAKWEERLAYSQEPVTVEMDGSVVFYKAGNGIPDFLQSLSTGDSVTVWMRNNGITVTSTLSAMAVTDELVALGNLQMLIVYADNYTYEGLVFPERGLYSMLTSDGAILVFGIAPAGSVEPALSWSTFPGVGKTVDPKYLPGGSFLADVDTPINIAFDTDDSGTPFYTPSISFKEAFSLSINALDFRLVFNDRAKCHVLNKGNNDIRFYYHEISIVSGSGLNTDRTYYFVWTADGVTLTKTIEHTFK